ncbi:MULTISPECIES: cytochrome P450 [unclassified Mycolicibacterium]|uniref:cytochrome P450 n=1 Tax=unclassified Mycolicibacterium TaxID=2636767 RepID=UPI0012DDBC9E|nr:MULTISPECIES: cytochrome P450 [unclassified Mycolicibacterium]MUL83808.1 cytochrome P450 [Mycolicibacterium sp. CBMA 329]MUL90126.1 cytochrome P450 [Mycolicibacterium sp. CBMA 331]MUL97855.1 cytochrome P450 [Mycolicibacterium sp. CBMA 334]MUM26995.1 cytochrome P450 [Mycolicibacterium sp. CBMA 295]MUM39641.1 cytochrome P450 [Mycolicibacterium sp. CBMA 247]
MAQATTDPVRLPPGPKLPKIVTGVAFLAARHRAIAAIGKRYGSAFSIDLPIFGETVVVSDAALLKDLFTASGDLVGRANNLGAVLGPGSTFSLDGEELRARRKLLMPAFHGKRMAGYEIIVAEEVLRETAGWPEGREFATLPSMMRITLNAILRTVFGAQGESLDELRELLPPMVPLASRMAILPAALRRDLGPWSPWGRVQRSRRRYNEIVAALIADARADPAFSDRSDVLALMLQARYEDGSPIADDHIADELLTLLAAGHETTATTLAWAVERLRRHPRLLARLTAETDAGGSELRQATIWEVQRTRPVIAATSRVARERMRLGEWVIPKGHVVIASITAAHDSEDNFRDAKTFDPDRFLGVNPDTHTWIPYGGGIRRCIGAAFANMEMNVVLRMLLREFEFRTTYSPGERSHSRGIATAPGNGGLAVVYRRKDSVTVSSLRTVEETRA